MKLNIRNKLILAISILMVVLFSLTSYLFINEKKKEMAEDIYLNSLAFSRLTAPSIARFHDLYLEQNGFVYFNREIASIFDQNDDIDRIMVVSFAGELLYDSLQDVDKKYEGEVRMIEDIEDIKFNIDQIRSENISLNLQNGRTVYIKDDPASGLEYVDKDEKPVAKLKSGPFLDNLIVPGNEKYTIVYHLNYHNMDERVAVMQRRIIYLGIFAIMLGMIFSFIMSSQVTKPVAKLVDSAGEIAKGNFKTRVDIHTRDELSYLGEAFNKMATDLEASMQAKVYKERVMRELELATQIQQQIIPKKIPQVEGLDVSAGLIPASEIGGDIYDFLPLSEKRMLMYLGDVTGHGVPAGIVSSIANSLFYGFASNPDLKEILVAVNRVMKVKTMPTMFMTLCLMDWDGENRKFTYASAGHEQILHYRGKTKDTVLEPGGGIALGMMKDFAQHIKTMEVDFQVGDYLIIYSDGIPEAWKNDTETYGLPRFQAAVKQFGDLQSAAAMKDAILADVKVFSAGHEQMDDITLVVLRRV